MDCAWSCCGDGWFLPCAVAGWGGDIDRLDCDGTVTSVAVADDVRLGDIVNDVGDSTELDDDEDDGGVYACCRNRSMSAMDTWSSWDDVVRIDADGNAENTEDDGDAIFFFVVPL